MDFTTTYRKAKGASTGQLNSSLVISINLLNLSLSLVLTIIIADS